MDVYLNDYEQNENNDSFSDTDELDDFLISNSDYIYNLYQDLQDRFACVSPAFLCQLRFYHIFNFFCDLVLYKKTDYNCVNKPLLNQFNNFYNSELQISYGIVYGFLKRHFRFTIQYTQWSVFCYCLSAKYELNRKDY